MLDQLDGRPAGKPQHPHTHQPRRTPKAMNRPVASSTEEFDAAAAAIDVPAAAPPVPGAAPPPPLPGAPAPPVPDTPPAAGGWREQALGALWRARDHLLDLQHPEGWWKGELADQRDDGRRGPAAARVPRHPRAAAQTERTRRAGSARSSAPTASWANFYGGPATSRPRSRPTSRCGSRAIRPTPRTCARPRQFVRERAALEQRPRLHPHLAGAVRRCGRGSDVPVLPPELMLLPPWAAAQRLRLRAAGRGRRSSRCRSSSRSAAAARCRSRSTSCTARRRGRRRARRSLRGRAARWASTGRCTRYERRPLRRAARLRAGAAPSAGSCDRQEADGSWGGIQPPWVYSIIALHLRGYPLDHPVMQRGPRGPRTFHDRGRQARRLEACQSPGLGHGARGRRARRRRRARADDPGAACAPPTGCSARRSRSRGDWSVRRPAARARRLGVRVRERQLPRRRRHGRGGARAAARAPPRRRARRGADRARRGAGSRACRAATAAGAPSTPTTPARSSASCRSATSAR